MSDAAKLIFFSHSRIMFHVFFLFFSAAIRHIAQSGIYFRRIIPAWLLPASHNQSSCLTQSILLPHTINPLASHNHSYSLPAYSLSFIIWLSFIMCRYLSCRHPHPGDYLFSDICPMQHKSPVCQYGSGVRQ